MRCLYDCVFNDEIELKMENENGVAVTGGYEFLA